MNSTSETACEAVPALPSSPPGITSISNTNDMDNRAEAEPEPHPTRDAQPALRRVGSDATERPPSAQQTQHAPDDEASETSEQESDEQDEDADPAHRIDDFDWEDLHHRYHEAIKACHGEEAALLEEWENLMIYFRTWAQSGHEHETDRSYARLCTRTAYVQHSEDALEQKRNHYVSVVRAFESALNLLKASGLGR